jgi:hypothetical protein
MADMRGDDREPGAMFSYVSAEQRVPRDHPVRAIRKLVDEVLRDMSGEFDGLYAPRRPSVDSARASAARAVAADLVLDSQRATVDGTAGLQPAVSVVRRYGHGRADLGADGVLKEPRPAVESGDRAQLLPSRGGAREGPDVRRAFQR